MAKSRDWTEILIRRGVIGPDQLKEANRMESVAEEERVGKGVMPTPTTS
jgi:type IV pilus assembly protein PilB